MSVQGKHIIKPDEPMPCPICGHPLILHDFNPFKSAWGFYHCDVHMKCPNCSLWLTFGVPISEEDFRKLFNSPLKSKVLTREVLDLIGEVEDDVKREVEERLRRWGYW